MATPSPWRTMRLRFAGTCAVCQTPLDKGETAHYVPATKTVRCLSCGPPTDPAGAADTPPRINTPIPEVEQPMELRQAPLPGSATCDDCGRRLRRGAEALFAPGASPVLCLECVELDTVHTLGVAGAGARREHTKRVQRHQTRVRTAHPRLGGLILALNDDPSHVRAWQTGAVGEEGFGRALSGIASEHLKVLHDRKIPRSAANIDHIAVTGEAVWVLDSKRYKGKVETRGHGLFSRRPPDLYVDGRNQMKLVAGVQRQAEIVRAVLEPMAAAYGDVQVRSGLVFVDAEFGLFASPFLIDDVWVGWGKAVRRRLVEQTAGGLPVPTIAKHLARALRAG